MNTQRSEQTLTVDQALSTARDHHQAGRHQQAEQYYRAILAHQPTHPEANYQLGAMALQLGKPTLGLAYFRAATENAPDREIYWTDYFEALLASGRPEELLAIFASPEGRRPGASATHQLRERAAECRQAIDELLRGHHAATPAEAAGLAERFTRRWPHAPLGWTILAACRKRLGQREEALHAAETAMMLAPLDAAMHSNLGVMLMDAGRLEEAETSCRAALRIQPDHPDALCNLGNVLHAMNRPEEAEHHYRQAIATNPDHSEAFNNLGNLLRELGRSREAESACRRAIEINPRYAEALGNLGNALRDQGQPEKAEQAYRRALERSPDASEFHNHLGTALQDQGRWSEAAAAYREALKINPDNVEAHSNLLFCLDGGECLTADDRYAEALRFGERATRRARRHTAWKGSAEPERTLRVGLVSGDLRSHPVGYFLESVLPELSAGRMELSAYPTRHGDDALSRRIRPLFARWQDIHGLSDEAAARLIHDDGIDILIDLAGHTALNRLALFAWKPAPVQLSWLGYTATTGVAEIDYYLTDPVRVPPEMERYYTEEVWRLPDTRVCFTPPDTPLPVAPSPARRNGHITFGCFQNLAKIGERVLRAWREILRIVPTARLRIQSKQLADPTLRERFERRLADLGIATERVTLLRATEREDYLEAHREVDLILDTFPYPGGTTTCEALWMGVPTLTLAGDTETSRNGASQMSCAGLPEWVAATEREYIDKAAAFAGEPATLAALRAELRPRVADSPLFDARRFATHFEQALRAMWRECHHRRPERAR